MNDQKHSLQTIPLESKEFDQFLILELSQRGLGGLPLQQGLSQSSVALDDELSVVILGKHQDSTHIHVKVALFYTGIIAGCNCADDPSPADVQQEHCEIMASISKQTGDIETRLLP